MSNWPDKFPDPEEIERLKREQHASWPASDDMPVATKPGKRQRPPKEKVLPTWGIPASTGKEKGKRGDGWGGKKTAAPEYPPVDKVALEQAAEDAAWAARQQKEIAKANKQQARDARAAARDARKAREWQDAAEREIAAANRGSWERRGGATYYDETTAEGRSGCGRGPRGGCILLPTWLVVLILILLLAGMWASG